MRLLSSPPHYTPSSERRGQKVVTNSEARPGSDATYVQHYPTINSPSGTLYYDPDGELPGRFGVQSTI